MTPSAKIGAPQTFERYTDEFLYQHPNVKIQNLLPLRTRVATRDGFKDDAVALAHLQTQRDESHDACERLHACHEQRMQAALAARQAWETRRSLQHRGDTDIAWALVHACMQRASSVMPREPSPEVFKRPSTFALLARHLGTRYAAALSARRVMDAQLRLAACEEALSALRDDLAALRKAVQLDLAHGTRPSAMTKHAKLKARLDAVIDAQARLQEALAQSNADAQTFESSMTSLPPSARAAYASLVPPPNLLGVVLPRNACHIDMPTLLSADAGMVSIRATTSSP